MSHDPVDFDIYRSIKNRLKTDDGVQPDTPSCVGVGKPLVFN